MYTLNFNFLTQFCREIGVGQSFFKVKRGEPLIYHLSIHVGGWFLDAFWNFVLSINLLKKEQFLRFYHVSCSSLKFGHNWILSRGHSYFGISTSPQIDVCITNLIDCCRYRTMQNNNFELRSDGRRRKRRGTDK